MEETYQIHENFLYLENKIFRGMDQIKQLRIYPPENGSCKIIVVYEVPDQEELPQNGHELSIDLGQMCIRDRLNYIHARNVKNVVIEPMLNSIKLLHM